jgi:hypothetical protein
MVIPSFAILPKLVGFVVMKKAYFLLVITKVHQDTNKIQLTIQDIANEK